MKEFPGKFWVEYAFHLINNPEFDISKTSPSSNIMKLYLERQQLPFKDFLFLSASAVVVDIIECNLKHVDGTDVKLENIFGALKNVRLLRYTFPENSSVLLTPNTMKEISKLENLKNLKSMEFVNIHECFDFEEFVSSFCENHKTIKYQLRFKAVNYETVLKINAFIDLLFENPHIPFNIYYPGIDHAKSTTLWKNFAKFE